MSLKIGDLVEMAPYEVLAKNDNNCNILSKQQQINLIGIIIKINNFKEDPDPIKIYPFNKKCNECGFFYSKDCYFKESSLIKI